METKRFNDEKNKTPNPKINYFYVSNIFFPKYIKYRDRENR